jgi:multiple sugar transport system substrate-binding protein/raffinose/stachyose/melibiose transport system substrate-binding protein
MKGLRRMPRVRWQKPAAATAAALAVVTGLAACGGPSGGGNSGTASVSGAPTVSVWSWRSQDAKLWKTVQADLAEQGTKVNIEFRAINPTSYDQVLQTAMNGGKGPDVFYDRAGYGTQNYAAAGMVKPLNGIVKNHISVPTTWTGFLGAMRALKQHGVTPMYVMGVQPWMLALQIDAVGASTMPGSFTKALTDKSANFTGNPYVKTLTAFQQLSPYLESNWQATGSADNEQETALALGKCGFIIDGIFDLPQIHQVNPSVQLGQFLVPSPDGQQAKIDWYPDGDISLNSHISNKAEASAAAKVVAFTSSKAFGQAFSGVAGEISPITGTSIPSKYPLAIQAAQWFRTKPITPIFGIRSPMDSPPPNPTALKQNKSPDVTAGIFTSEQNVAVPLLEGKLTPAKAAAQVQKAEAWYFNGTAPPPPSPSPSH